MDLNSLRDTVTNLTLYDVKAGVRKMQNAVMNYTEMEAKVREATNNEPWGASSTQLQEIANGTHSYQLLNEIMPMIYKRFTEKSAEEWRQIYKALQLLEFLIKNGSERVIDDARGHISLLKMLRQFQYLDMNGKDQGINVRNRAKELAELLSDVERIRTERKKARANRNKFGGVEGGAGVGFGGTGSRYGGFSSEDAQFGGFSGGVYGDGGGFGGQERGGPSGGFSDGARRDKFEEYDEADDQPSASRHNASTARRKPDPPKPKEPEVDLFEFGDDDIPPAAPPKPGAAAAGKQPDLTGGDDDDDFDDFISAAPSGGNAVAPTAAAAALSSPPPPGVNSMMGSANQFAQPKPQALPANIPGLMGAMAPAPPGGSSGGSAFSSPPPSQSANSSQVLSPGASRGGPPKPANYQAATPNYFTSVQVQAAPAGGQQQQGQQGGARPGMHSNASFGSTGSGPGAGLGGMASSNAAASKPAASKASGGDAFGNLWSSASAGAGIKKDAGQKGPNLAAMQKERTERGIWGPNAQAPPTNSQQGQKPPGMGLSGPASMGGGNNQQQGGGGLDDLLG